MREKFIEILELYKESLLLTGDVLKEYLEAHSLQRGICYHLMAECSLSSIIQSYFKPIDSKEQKYLKNYCKSIDKASLAPFPYTFLGGWSDEETIKQTIKVRILHLYSILDKLKYYEPETAS